MRRAWATALLAAAWVGVHVVSAAGMTTDQSAPALLAWWGPRPERALIAWGAFYLPLAGAEPWRLLTAPWLHVDGVHAAGNVVGLWALHRVAPDEVGAGRWLSTWAAGAFVGALTAQLAGVVLCAGASGGLYALLGLLTVTGPGRRWLLVACVLGLLSSWWLPQIVLAAHLGGLSWGVASGAWIRAASGARSA